MFDTSFVLLSPTSFRPGLHIEFIAVSEAISRLMEDLRNDHDDSTATHGTPLVLIVLQREVQRHTQLLFADLNHACETPFPPAARDLQAILVPRQWQRRLDEPPHASVEEVEMDEENDGIVL